MTYNTASTIKAEATRLLNAAAQARANVADESLTKEVRLAMDKVEDDALTRAFRLVEELYMTELYRIRPNTRKPCQ